MDPKAPMECREKVEAPPGPAEQRSQKAVSNAFAPIAVPAL